MLNSAPGKSTFLLMIQGVVNAWNCLPRTVVAVERVDSSKFELDRYRDSLEIEVYRGIGRSCG